MTNDQIRQRIAEICGWMDIKFEQPRGEDEEKWCGVFTSQGIRLSHGELPNYPESLDACHEMEETLESDKERKTDYYCTEIPRVTKTCTDDWMFKQLPPMVHATALQRCRAFLAVHGVDTEGQP